MGDSSVDVEHAISRAIELTHARQHGAAGQLLLRVLCQIETQPVDADWALRLGKLADVCQLTGHPDLSLMALRDLLGSAAPNVQPSRRCADLLTLANCWTSLGRATAASSVNEAALALAVEHACWADAASASTNLAAFAAGSGQLDIALERLQESLGYLAQDNGNPDTDAITRLALLRVVDALDADPAPALAASADLFTRLAPHVGRERWEEAAPAFQRLVERHLAAHPEIDAQAWKRATFPRVYGDAP